MGGYAQAIMGAGLVTRLIGVRPPETITVYHVTKHVPLASSRNDEADTLAKVQWLEMVPASPSGREVAEWIHHHLLCAVQKTMWSTIKTWGLPVTLTEAQEACETCVACS